MLKNIKMFTIMLMAVIFVALPIGSAYAVGLVYQRSMPVPSCPSGGAAIVWVLIYKSPFHPMAKVDMSSFLRIEDAITGMFLFGQPMEPNPNVATADPASDVITGVGKIFSCSSVAANIPLNLTATIILRDDIYDPELELRPSCNIGGPLGDGNNNPIKACQLAVQMCQKEFFEITDSGAPACKKVTYFDYHRDSDGWNDLNVLQE